MFDIGTLSGDDDLEESGRHGISAVTIRKGWETEFYDGDSPIGSVERLSRCGPWEARTNETSDIFDTSSEAVDWLLDQRAEAYLQARYMDNLALARRYGA